QPRIEIGLQFGKRAIELLAEGNAVELVQQRLVEPLTNAVGLRAPRLGARVIDVLDRKVELVLVVLGLAAKFRAAIGEYATDRDLILLEERHHPIVHQVGGGEWRLPIIELGEGYLRIGIDRRLLVDAPDALERAHIERVLRHAVTRTLARELAVGLFVEFG